MEELQEAKTRVVAEEHELKKQIKRLDMNLENKDLDNDLKEYFKHVENILALNNPTNIKLWLKEMIFSIDVFLSLK